MSFQLYFYRPVEQAVLTIGDVQDVLLAADHFRLAEDGSSVDFEYENPITGVYFWFSFNKNAYADEQILQFPKHRFTGLYFTINYHRPSYFMYEANPIVLQLIQTLRLYVFDPQTDAASSAPFQPYSDELIRSWQAGNRRIGSKSPFRVSFDRDKARYAWEYLYRYPAFKDLLPSEHFVPKLFFIRLKDENVHTAVVFPYPDTEHQLIPNVDYLYVKISRKQLWFRKSVEGLISFSQLRMAAPDAFQAVSDPLPHFLLDNRVSLEPILQTCDVIRKDRFAVLPNDGFVDLDPPQPTQASV
jgi:hypothetical protein